MNPAPRAATELAYMAAPVQGTAWGIKVLEAAADHRQNHTPLTLGYHPCCCLEQDGQRLQRGNTWASSFFTAAPSTSCWAWQTGAT